MPEISVIVVNWNGRHFLNDCLSGLRRQTFRDFETILVDNGSDDGSVEHVRQHFPEVRLLALDSNQGFTGGNIAGYELARGNLIVLLNNDTEAHPQWLESIYRGSISYPDAGSFASKMMYFDNRKQIENCGFQLGKAGTTLELGRDEADGSKWMQPRTVFGGCGGAVAYRRSMLEEIGFFDPDFFMIYEDVDLSFRAQLSGYDCVYLPQAIVYHRYRSTLGRAPTVQVFYAQRNIEFVYLKNIPALMMLRSFPWRIAYELGAAAYFIRHGAGLSFARAKIEALKNLPDLLAKRRRIQRAKTRSNHQLRAMLQDSMFLPKWRKLFAQKRAVPTRLQSPSPATGNK